MFQRTLNLTLPSPVLPNHRLRRQSLVVSASSSMTAPDRRPANLYEVLKIKETASQIEIKTAYRTLAKLFHPDASPATDTEGRDFIEIHGAYATLSDPTARARYDMSIGRMRFAGEGQTMRRTRRWETDQCW
ncbi:hypothetical protein QJS04_geneDACA013813 [Acorus gramineus]|uniref:J domain-containing protein n=1 Tax=Acorus gramineus TaxID=55184 RepID=A0AAV9B122_ACOGR|nr:hypothetical protein QJS04_geneDACA013813 [Acorus gramineus]